MPRLLTTNATVSCPHGGQGQSTSTNPLAEVQGGTVLVEGDTGVVSGCVMLPPCVSYTLHSMGLNATEVGERAAILETDIQFTTTGMPLTCVETHPVWDDTTPAPLPATGPGTVPAELLDDSAPVVAVAPPTMTYVVHLAQPAAIPVVFTLAHAFPLRWLLRWSNMVTSQGMDVTSGTVGLLVVPPGPDWSTPAATVSATLSTPFLASLPPGMHELQLTAVSRRGRFASARFRLTVSP